MTGIAPRIPETDKGVAEAATIMLYDQMMREMKQRGLLITSTIIGLGIHNGVTLEIGPGPGYVGLEWLKHTTGTRLVGIDISADMIELVGKNAKDYGFKDRTEYVLAVDNKMPFDDHTFDGVFTNNSLHEWTEPEALFNEIYRVLKPGGRFFVSDFRRDIDPVGQSMMELIAKPEPIRQAFHNSINAAYTVDEIKRILEKSNLKDYVIKLVQVPGMIIFGTKET